MNFSPSKSISVVCFFAILFGGCYANPPAYLRDNGDLSYYLEQATEIEYPDVQTAQLDEVTQALPPITVSDPDFCNYWNLTLEECVSIALQNSKVLRGYGTPGVSGSRVAAGIDNLTNNPAGVGTTYNVAIRESEPGFIGTSGQIAQLGNLETNTSLDANQGVEAALADFDAQISSSLFWDKTDRPRNTNGNLANSVNPLAFFQQDQVVFNNQIAKRTAVGTQLLARTVSTYTRNNNPSGPAAPGVFQSLSSWYEQNLEFEARQPLLRGRGAFINRMPVVIARIGTDQEIANLQTQLQNVLTNVEIRYWDLWCAYKLFGIAKKNFNESLDGWRRAEELRKAGTIEASVEAGAREQYFFFQAQVKRAWQELIQTENDLRFLLGVSNTDGNVIRPCDEPTKADIKFEWCSSLEEALCLRPELRQQRWEIKKKQLALAYSKNALLPNLNAFGLYRFLGLGDDLANYNNNVPRYPLPNSGAFNELARGNYQEFRLGVEFGMPVGFRRELANVRNAQLKLAREMARTEDMELDVARELSQGFQLMDLHYELAIEYLNRFKAASSEVDAEIKKFKAKGDNFTQLVDARRRNAQAEIDFYQSLCEYNKVIALIHRRKGTIMCYCGVAMAEGPWPGKAYHDAAENARRRSSSRAVNYGFTRPGVISTGTVPNCGCGGVGCDACAGDAVEGEFIEGDGQVIHDYLPGNQYQSPGQITPGNVLQPESIESMPVPNRLPTPARPRPGDSGNLRPTRNNVANGAKSLSASIDATIRANATPVQFDRGQIPPKPSAQELQMQSRGMASAQIRLMDQKTNNSSQLARAPQAGSNAKVTNRLRVVQASHDETVGSGLRGNDQSNANIRRVNYEQ